MKKYIFDFIHRGLVACGFGPLVWAIVYFFLEKNGVVEVFPVQKAVMEVITITLLAFIAGGINIVYKIERLPLMAAIALHGIVLYFDYVIIYLINRWLDSEPIAFFIFTAVFIGSYALFWTILYLIIKRNANRMNQKLSQLQKQDRITE